MSNENPAKYNKVTKLMKVETHLIFIQGISICQYYKYVVFINNKHTT